MDYMPKGATVAKMCALGGDILQSPHVQALRTFVQHGTITRYEHCLSVCYIALRICERLHIRVDERSMVRGALLHDYFLYDWHDPSNLRVLHGFTHAREALRNARREFELNEIESDVIKKHMFPLNITPPRFREAVIVSIADKISAVMETLHVQRGLRIARVCGAVGRL